MGELVVDLLFKGQVLRTVPFDRPTLRVGRMRENDIVVDNLSVSRFHARLHLEGGRVFFEDAGSENGSFVNDARVHGRVELAPGDCIAVGKHQMRVRSRQGDETGDSDAAATAEPRRSDPWDAMQTYLAGPETHARLREAGVPAPATAACEESSDASSDPPGAGAPADPASDAPTGPASEEPKAPASDPPLHAGLIVQRDGRIDRAVSWDGEQLTVGRSADCDLPLPQDEISRHHARFVRSEDGYEVLDLGSVNGTLVNGERVERRRLEVGDVVQIESFQLTFVLDREPITAALASPARPAAGAPDHDRFGVTILAEELPLVSEVGGDEEEEEEPGIPASADPTPVTVDGGQRGPSPLEVDLVDEGLEASLEASLEGSLEGSLQDSLETSIDDRKELAEAQPRGSSRASSVQALGAAPDPACSVTLELRLRLDALPEPLRRALEALGAEGVEIPAEVRLRGR